jgi:hypothetical protein
MEATVGLLTANHQSKHRANPLLRPCRARQGPPQVSPNRISSLTNSCPLLQLDPGVESWSYMVMLPFDAS